MKKIIYLAVLVLTSFLVKAQYPVNQSLGSDSTMVTVKGAIKGRVVLNSFTDTAQANLQRIKSYPVALIFTTSDSSLWIRNTGASKWDRVYTSGGSATNPNLQNVTDVNNETTNNLIVNSGFGSKTYQSGSAFVIEQIAANKSISINATTLTSDRTATLQDTSGTIAYLHDITGGSGWGLSGNTITAGQYLGTNNGEDLVLKVSGDEIVRYKSNAKNITINSYNTTNINDSSSIFLNTPDLTSGNGLFIKAPSLTNGAMINLLSNGTATTGAGATSQRGINVKLIGLNTTRNASSFGAYLQSQHTGRQANNWGIYAEASGGLYNTGSQFVASSGTPGYGTNAAVYATATGGQYNYSGVFDQGDFGIGTVSPTAKLHVLQATPASVATTSVTATASPTTIIGGNGGATSSSGGTVNAGNAGHIILTGGNGGAITGSPTTGVGGAGGNITPTAGDGGTGTTQGGNGGNFEAQGGNSGFGTAIGVAGYSAIKGGNAFPSGNGNGGNVFLTAGSKNGSGQDGTIFLGLSPSLVSRGNTVIGSSTDDYTNKLQVTGTVRFQGLPTGVGTKALRIDGSGNLSVADTTSGGGSPSLTTNQLGFGVAGVLGSDAGFTRIAAGQLQNEASVNAMISLKRTGTDYSHWRIYNGINGAGLGFNAADYGLFRFVLQPDGEFRLGGNALATPATLNGLTNGKVGIGVEPVNILDVAGSFGNAITTTSANLTLTDAHHTVIITSGTPTITLPAAGATNTRREYVLVNQTVGLITISSYLDFAGASATTIPITGAITIQSDGTNWYRVN